MNQPADLIEGVDFYREGPYVVFTELYLRNRGYCCESGCRHCPYGFDRTNPTGERQKNDPGQTE